MEHYSSVQVTDFRAAYLGNPLGKALEREAFLPLLRLLIAIQHIIVAVIVRHRNFDRPELSFYDTSIPLGHPLLKP